MKYGVNVHFLKDLRLIEVTPRFPQEHSGEVMSLPGIVMQEAEKQEVSQDYIVTCSYCHLV